ncbi:MAG: (2Fe-2S)-binding protein [Dehalococcoidales bacterium]|nr:(2Fe-2S)-binding protein [Dehalococcoidales bacterium]
MSEKKKKSKERVSKTGLSRREFLAGTGIVVGGAAIGSVALLAACSGDGETETVTQTVTQTQTQTVTTTVMGPGGEAIEGIVTLKVNGEDYTIKTNDNWTLAYVLREKLGLTGTKRACDDGSCGFCTVIMDGRPVLSCLVLTIETEGKSVETVEGLAKDSDKLHPLQQAFIDNDALQCGLCTPGQLMTAKALLDFIPNPTEDQVREYQAGALCRCGAHRMIVTAILEAAG